MAGLAGCFDSSGPGNDGTASTDDRPSTTGTAPGDDPGGGDTGVGTAREVDGRTVRVAELWTSRAIVRLLAGAHPSVSAAKGRQYLVVGFDVDGDDPMDAARSACELRADQLVYEPVSEVVLPFTEPTHLAFSLPVDVDVNELTLAWVGDASTTTWTLPDRVIAALETPPTFDVRSFDVPATADGDSVVVSFTVANVGEGDGEFLAELGTRAVSDQGEIRVAVDAGESKTVTERVGLVPSGGDQRVVLDWGSDSIERTVSVPTTTE